MNILYPINGAKGLFLPFETCTNATKWCKKNCYQKKVDFPTNKQRIQTLVQLIDKSPREFADILLKELNGDILHWFVSGDCWNSTALNFFYETILILNNFSIKQCGFTRNHDLWLKVPDILIYSQDYGFDIHNHIKRRIESNCPTLIKLIKDHNLRIAIPNEENPKNDCGVKIFEYVISNEETEVVEVRESQGCGYTGKIRYESRTNYHGFAHDIDMDKNCSKCYSKNKGCFNRKPFTMEHHHVCLNYTIDVNSLPYEIRLKLLKLGIEQME